MLTSKNTRKMHTVRLGTRGSRLALWQADFVAAELKKAVPALNISCAVIKTEGDRVLDPALWKTREKGFFSSEIEKELLDENIDIAVHSLKDLPSRLDDKLCIGAVLKRETPLDVLLSPEGHTFDKLPPDSVLGTSSLRRTALIRALRPDIRIEPVRGNVETRIRKIQQQGLDGIILAHAGVKRLGFEHMITQVLLPDIIMPAAGQGVIAVEVKTSNSHVRNFLKKINDVKTHIESLSERSFLQRMHGGCQVPIGCMALLSKGNLLVQGVVASLDGKEVFRAQINGKAEDGAETGIKLAEKILSDGAERILSEI